MNNTLKYLCRVGIVFLLLIAVTGCVRRTMTITTEPPNALIFLNDEEIGRSEVTTDFLWYGDYDVVVRKEGYQTLHTNWEIEPPWYQVLPIDFFTEVLWPGQFHDKRERHFVLNELGPVDKKELIKRAEATRKRAFDPRK